MFLRDDVLLEDKPDEEERYLIDEGKASLYTPRRISASSTAPLSTRTSVFYNPAMIFNRDVSVLVLETLLFEGTRLLDGLSATGVRGIRYAKEIGTDLNICFNDRSPKAVELIRKNIELNFPGTGHQGRDFNITNQDLNILLHSEKFDCIDIDPFGSPVGFLDSAMRGLKSKGILAITATDTSTLCGTYPRTSLRRYGSWVPRNPFTHEVGIRNLIAAVLKVGARYNKALTPLLAHATHYYYRVYFRARNSRESANALLSRLGYLLFDPGSPEFWTLAFSQMFGTEGLASFHPEQTKVAGPLWLGSLFDKDLLDSLVENLDDHSYLQTYPMIQKHLELWRGEAGFGPFFYGSDRMSSQLKRPQPKMEHIFAYLKNKGYRVSRTHFDPYGIKTDASCTELLGCFRK